MNKYFVGFVANSRESSSESVMDPKKKAKSDFQLQGNAGAIYGNIVIPGGLFLEAVKEKISVSKLPTCDFAWIIFSYNDSFLLYSDQSPNLYLKLEGNELALTPHAYLWNLKVITNNRLTIVDILKRGTLVSKGGMKFALETKATENDLLMFQFSDAKVSIPKKVP
jgi:hypothetical protein